jgi:hypothetical protein
MAVFTHAYANLIMGIILTFYYLVLIPKRLLNFKGAPE